MRRKSEAARDRLHIIVHDLHEGLKRAPSFEEGRTTSRRERTERVTPADGIDEES